MDRSKRVKIARETLIIFKNGFYLNKKKKRINIEFELKNAIKNSIHYKPEMFNKVFRKRDKILNQNISSIKTNFEVTNETTLGAARRLINEEKNKNVLCLNFASATTPGGGFLKGSQAQEESLARATGLYPCISQMKEMYDINKKFKSALYTDHMIYSPEVPVIRDDRDELLDSPFYTSIITVPAVNAMAVKKNEFHNISLIKETMLNRIEKLLSLAIIHNHKTLVLGAWGCGVFKNNPSDVADYFSEYLLNNNAYNKFFKKIAFAILDRTKEMKKIMPFKKRFSNLLISYEIL